MRPGPLPPGLAPPPRRRAPSPTPYLVDWAVGFALEGPEVTIVAALALGVHPWGLDALPGGMGYLLARRGRRGCRLLLALRGRGGRHIVAVAVAARTIAVATMVASTVALVCAVVVAAVVVAVQLGVLVLVRLVRLTTTG